MERYDNPEKKLELTVQPFGILSTFETEMISFNQCKFINNHIALGCFYNIRYSHHTTRNHAQDTGVFIQWVRSLVCY